MLAPVAKAAGFGLVVIMLSCGDDAEEDERSLYDYTPPRNLGIEPWRGGALIEQD